MDYRQYPFMPEYQYQYEFNERQSPYGWESGGGFPGGGPSPHPFPGGGGGFPGGGMSPHPFPGGGGGFPGGGPSTQPFPGSGGSFPGGGPSMHPFPGGGGHAGSPFPGTGGGQSHEGPPTSPPPSYTPQEQAAPFAVDPGAIRRCLYRYTFIWLNNGRSFWFYPTYVGRTSVAGYRWRGFRWVFYGTDLNRIRSFRCS